VKENGMKLANLAAALAMVSASGGPAMARPQVEFAPMSPRLPFSPAVRVGDVLYLSGQIGNDANNRLPVGIEAQGRQAMENIAGVLKSQGATMNDVFKCTVYLADMRQWAAFNAVYLTYFNPKRLPARSAMGVNGLVAGALLEIECWAYAPRK
jgi:2-iminobutanoate/2-iminopropanoate deaminase